MHAYIQKSKMTVLKSIILVTTEVGNGVNVLFSNLVLIDGVL